MMTFTIPVRITTKLSYCLSCADFPHRHTFKVALREKKHVKRRVSTSIALKKALKNFFITKKWKNMPNDFMVEEEIGKKAKTLRCEFFLVLKKIFFSKFNKLSRRVKNFKGVNDD